MKLFILTPEKTIYEGEAISLQVQGQDSSFQLLEHHVSMIAFLNEINLQLQLYQEKSIDHFLILEVKNGILEVKNGMVKILVNS